MVDTSIPWTETLTALATGTTTLILALAALYARRQARETRWLREAQVRPFVVLGFEIDDYPLVILRIKNTGPVLARNVQFSFEPALETTDVIHKTPLRERPIFRQGIPSLAPGRGLPVLFDTHIQREAAGLPMSYLVEIQYEGEQFRSKGRRAQYADTVILDLEVFKHAVRLEGNPTKRLVEALGKIQLAIKEGGSSSPFTG